MFVSTYRYATGRRRKSLLVRISCVQCLLWCQQPTWNDVEKVVNVSLSNLTFTFPISNLSLTDLDQESHLKSLECGWKRRLWYS